MWKMAGRAGSQRTKQTARKSTGGAAPRRQLAGKDAASRAAASHANQEPFLAGERGVAAERVLSPVEKIVAEVPPQVLVERGIGGMMTIDEAKRKYTLTDWDLRKLPRTKVDGRRGGNPGGVQVVGVLAAALQKHGEHTFVRLLAILAYKEARQEAENARLRWREASREADIERLQQEVERLRPGTATGQSLEGGGVKRGGGAAALEQEGASWTSFNFWVAENKDRIRRENPDINNARGAFARGCLSGRVLVLNLVWLVAGAGGLSALMGEKWKQLTPEQRGPYERMRDAQPVVAAALEARALEEKACVEARRQKAEKRAARERGAALLAGKRVRF